MRALADDTERRLGKADAGIFRAQGELIADTDLITLACQLMVEGQGVAFAWNAAVERMAGRLSALGNPVLAARAADLHDVGRRVLAQIDPSLKSGHDLPDVPSILIAADLVPSDTAGLDPSRVIGLATAQGGPTSHTAILARTLGIPAMVAGGPTLTALQNHGSAILDGGTGRLYPDPSEADLAIVTVTLNPAIDQTVTLDALTPGHVHRARAVRSDAGVNVASCLADWGSKVSAAGISARTTPPRSRPCSPARGSTTASPGSPARPAPT